MDLPDGGALQDLVDQASKTGGLCVIKWYSPRCKACLAVKPKFESLAREASPTDCFGQIDHSANVNVAHKWGVKALPTFSVFSRNELVVQMTVTVSTFTSFANGLAAMRAEKPDGT